MVCKPDGHVVPGTWLGVAFELERVEEDLEVVRWSSYGGHLGFGVWMDVMDIGCSA